MISKKFCWFRFFYQTIVKTLTECISRLAESGFQARFAVSSSFTKYITLLSLLLDLFGFRKITKVYISI